MQITLHCPCGSRDPVNAEKMPSAKTCAKCGTALAFGPTVQWLLIGGRKGPSRAAVPIPRDVKLSIGNTPAQWLTLPGEDIGDPHAEILLGADDKLRVFHAQGHGGTWINTASIHEGVLRPQDSLFIGPYRLRVTTERPTKDMDAGADDRREPVIEPVSADRESTKTPLIVHDTDEVIPASKGRYIVAGVVATLAISYLGWWLIAPKFSKEMPSSTFYRCPADGTVVRGGWDDGFPKCPQCGALCVGGLRYKAEKSEVSPTTTAPTSQTTGSKPNKGSGP